MLRDSHEELSCVVAPVRFWTIVLVARTQVGTNPGKCMRPILTLVHLPIPLLLHFSLEQLANS